MQVDVYPACNHGPNLQSGPVSDFDEDGAVSKLPVPVVERRHSRHNRIWIPWRVGYLPRTPGRCAYASPCARFLYASTYRDSRLTVSATLQPFYILHCRDESRRFICIGAASSRQEGLDTFNPASPQRLVYVGISSHQGRIHAGAPVPSTC